MLHFKAFPYHAARLDAAGTSFGRALSSASGNLVKSSYHLQMLVMCGSTMLPEHSRAYQAVSKGIAFAMGASQ